MVVGLFGLIWRQGKGDGSDSIGWTTIGIAIFAFLVAFVLADNTLVGYEKMTAILLSFIAVSLIGLTIIKKKGS